MATAAITADLISLDISDATQPSSAYITPDTLTGSSSWDNDDMNTSDTDLSDSPLKADPDKIRQEENSVALDSYLENHVVNLNEKVALLSPPLSTINQDDSSPSARIIDQVRDYQQELFERAREENIIAVYAFILLRIIILTLC